MAETLSGVNGKIIQWAREYYNMSYEEAAQRIGVDVDKYKNWENGTDYPIEKGTYISVDECYNELEGQFSKDAVALKWISERKKMFKNPDDAESKIMCKIFEKPKFQESIHSKNILDNRPSADAYIVAKGKHLQATVVTKEAYKPNSAQLPNLCEAFDVPYISYDDFMEIVSNEI